MRRMAMGGRRVMAPILALALALGAGAEARAADTRLPTFGREPSARWKAERFLGRLEADGTNVAAWRAKLASAGERGVTGQIQARDLIHLVLLERSAEYRAAVAAFEKDALNAEDFAKLAAETKDPALRAHALFFQGRALLARDEFAKAAAALEEVRGPYHLSTAWADEATFFLGYAYARTPELEEERELSSRRRARHCLEAIAGAEGRRPLYADAPERTREGATWLLRELRGEGLGPLLELAKRMETIERLLEREHTDKPVQKKQEEVVVVLDKLIEMLREKEDGG